MYRRPSLTALRSSLAVASLLCLAACAEEDEYLTAEALAGTWQITEYAYEWDFTHGTHVEPVGWRRVDSAGSEITFAEDGTFVTSGVSRFVRSQTPAYGYIPGWDTVILRAEPGLRGRYSTMREQLIFLDLERPTSGWYADMLVLDLEKFSGDNVVELAGEAKRHVGYYPLESVPPYLNYRYTLHLER